MKSLVRVAASGCAAVLLCASAMSVSAQTTWGEEYARRTRATEMVSPLGDDAFGDSVSLYNGTVSFTATDISLPGNNALPVQLTRVFNPQDVSQGFFIGDWELDIPRISAVHPINSTTGWTPMPPGDWSNGSVSFQRDWFWSGNRLHLPGGGGDLLSIPVDPKRVKPSIPMVFSYGTKDGWFFSLLPTIPEGPGNGLVGYAPDGTKYTFDRLIDRDYGAIQHPYLNVYSPLSPVLDRKNRFLFVSKIEDRFGNWVRYEWVGSRLQRIYSSDGREITFVMTPFPGGNGEERWRLVSATANGRTWTYEVGAKLTAVVNPDGSRWTYAGPSHRLDVVPYDLMPGTSSYFKGGTHPCSPANKMSALVSTYSVSHPAGATAEFTFAPTRHGRTNVRYLCINHDDVSNERNRYSTYHDAWSLQSKQITGPGLPAAVYQYGYASLGQGYEAQDETRWDIGPGWNANYAPPAPNYKVVTVTQPDGTQQISTFGKDADLNEGQLFQVATKKAGVTYRVVDNDYVEADEAALLPFPSSMGNTGVISGDLLPNQNRPLKASTISQDGATFASLVNVFDQFARPISIQKSSSLGYAKTEGTEYNDNLDIWVLGQIKKSTVNGVVTSETFYDSATAMPISNRIFGQLRQSFSYYPDGTLKTVTDGRNNGITLSGWMRGLPQSIRYPPTPEAPTGALESAEVDSNGWIQSVKDENGYQTGYDYDTMGRLTKIAYPISDSVAWANTISSFVRVGASEYGIPSGHWKQTVSTGNARKITYFDGLWRPLVSETYDAANLAGTLSQSVNRYDADGRPVFQSYPLRGLTSYSVVDEGVRTQYDALDRVTRAEQDSDLGVLPTTTAYLAGFKTRVTNPRLKQTTTSYEAYDQPSTDWPVAIAHPGGAYTDIARNLFGKPETVTRRNSNSSIALTRRYVYDGFQQVCKTIEPETGTTVMAHDAAGNVTGSASGLNLPSGSCDLSPAQGSGRWVARTYDARNRVSSLLFPDGNGDQAWSYWPDGGAKSITTNNGFEQARNDYEFNKRRLLTRETLSQVGGDTQSLGYSYDTNGNLTAHTYPSGLSVAYAPNALGQPTKAGTYASGVSYYPNGGMAQFTYGNGIVHTLSQNDRGLPERSRDAYGATAVLDDSYDYDFNGNVAAISDALPGNRGNRDMTYDDLDRLVTATSPMFGAASYGYDVLDNLTTVKVNGRDHAYVYNSAWRLTNIANRVGGATVVGMGYDPQGNLENKNGQPYVFDYGNRLRKAINEQYRYDGHGRRIQAENPTQGDIYSFYGMDGVLRHQRNQRETKAYDYVSLNGSLVARIKSAVAPSVPVLTVPGYTTQSSYTVKWTAIPGTSTYELDEASNGGAWQVSYSGGALSKAVSGKVTGSYSYRVRACNVAGCSNWSATATVSIEQAPASPPSLTVPAQGLNGSYVVSWGVASGATSYALEESANGGGWTATYSGSARSKSFSGRAAGNYQYRIKSCNAIGCSGYSATRGVQVIHPPVSAPALSVSSPATIHGYTASWLAVAGGTRYVLSESALGGAWATVYDGTATSVSISGRIAGSHSYRATACNVAGCGPVSSITVAVIGPPTTAPLLTVPVSSYTGSYVVSWSKPTGASSYQLTEAINGGTAALKYNGAALSVPISGKANGNYHYSVRACNVAGCGPYAVLRSITVLLPPPASRIQLAKITLSRPGVIPVYRSCTVTWAASAGASRYEVKSGYDTVYTGPNTTIVGTGPSSYCVDNYEVRACNVAGCSAWSSPPFPATVVYRDIR